MEFEWHWKNHSWNGPQYLAITIYRPITIGPHKGMKICWAKTWVIASVLMPHQQIWAHLWGPGMMDVYCIMIIIKILRKRILIHQMFHDLHCQIILWQQLKETLRHAWLGCSPSGYTPSDDYGISTCNSNDVMCRAEGLSQAAILWKLAWQHTTKRRTQLLLYMMTSSNGNIFRVTGHLCGEFTGHRSIPRTKASDTELWCFLWSAPE